MFFFFSNPFSAHRRRPDRSTNDSNRVLINRPGASSSAKTALVKYPLSRTAYRYGPERYFYRRRLDSSCSDDIRKHARWVAFRCFFFLLSYAPRRSRVINRRSVVCGYESPAHYQNVVLCPRKSTSAHRRRYARITCAAAYHCYYLFFVFGGERYRVRATVLRVHYARIVFELNTETIFGLCRVCR